MAEPHSAFRSGPLTLDSAGLLTDLYELTMAAAYHRAGMTARATFSLFARRLPSTRGFLVAAGLQPALDYLTALRFDADSLAYLASLGQFDPDFLRCLGGLRFTGDVRAVPEGTLLGAEEPLMEVTAPVIEAQLVETALLNLCHVHTLLASKAARVVLAARGRPVSEFGVRRSQGMDAGLAGARSAWIAGCAATSDVLAGATWGLPLAGTMAHAFVTAFPSELDAFRAYATTFPDGATLLIDTYDTLEGARHAAVVAGELAAAGGRLAAVRLDSGDLRTLSGEVRSILDRAGLPEVRVVVSGGLDEHDVETLLASGAPIDGFGIGTRMAVSSDAPSLDLVYKMVRYAGRDVLKLSEGKVTWVGGKQVHRVRRDGRIASDVLALADEPAPAEAKPLLEPVMEGGALVRPHPPLAAARSRCAAELAALPEPARRLDRPEAWPVDPSAALRARQRSALDAVRARPA